MIAYENRPTGGVCLPGGDPNNLHFGREFFTCNYVLRSFMLPLKFNRIF